MRAPEMRSPGLGGTGAQDREAAAINNPCNGDTPRGWQVQRLIAAYALTPNRAALLAPFAFGEAQR